MKSFAETPKVAVKEIDLKAWFQVLKRRVWIICACWLLLAIVGAYLNSKPVTPLYQADTRIIIRGNTESSGTLIAMIREPVVMEGVIAELGLHQSPLSLRNQVSVTSTSSSQIVTISVIDSNPEQAAHIANAIITSYKQNLSTYLGWSNIVVLYEAEPASISDPINPKSKRTLYIGMLAGLLVGIVLAFLKESLDDTIRSKGRMEALLGIPVIGSYEKICKRHILAPQEQRERQTALRGETIGS